MTVAKRPNVSSKIALAEDARLIVSPGIPGPIEFERWRTLRKIAERLNRIAPVS
ncbi:MULTISPECIES: hypothetical protein [Burkholderia]|uniref:Uncharacterized protein n=1 Tax=Burkholderia anthina TaxID=179879 RepID=A0A7T6VHL6_9BURK|nr:MULTISPECIES: hypothetical protein [Burkholderia]MBY4865628.1 hypothetical protein [Burkholderia anthina]QQK04084.1 hypothetical protein JFN94_08025 [Burkholderia anthina]